MNSNRNNTAQCLNTNQRKHKVLNEKIINMTSFKKIQKNNYSTKWTSNLKKINYRNKILYKQKENEYT